MEGMDVLGSVGHDPNDGLLIFEEAGGMAVDPGLVSLSQVGGAPKEEDRGTSIVAPIESLDSHTIEEKDMADAEELEPSGPAREKRSEGPARIEPLTCEVGIGGGEREPRPGRQGRVSFHELPGDEGVRGW
jgi:hypothetical protein